MKTRQAKNSFAGGEIIKIWVSRAAILKANNLTGDRVVWPIPAIKCKNKEENHAN